MKKTAIGFGLFAVMFSGCNLFRTNDGSKTISTVNSVSQLEGCDVIVVGGSTAALGAALSAAREFRTENQGRVACLTEPTNWLGGQLTASGVPAIDWPHHKVPKNGKNLNLSGLSRDVANNPPDFAKLMASVAPPIGGLFQGANSPSACWVSKRCYEPLKLLPAIDALVDPLVQSQNLRVFMRSVPKSVKKVDGKIASVEIIQRTQLQNSADEELLSQVISDWYSRTSSDKFAKNSVTLAGRDGKIPVVIDATEWGEILVLADASYMQGVELSESAPSVTKATCGQAIIYPIAMEWSANSQPEPSWLKSFTPPHPEHYGLSTFGNNFTWESVWAYRRIRREVPVAGNASNQLFPGQTSIYGVALPAVGDISVQNWTQGNDYPYGYLYLPPAETKAQTADWMGGVSVSVLRDAEAHSIGWYSFMRNAAPESIRANLQIASVLGTQYGISKVPYIRDTRRSIGVGDFVMKFAGEAADGFKYPDSIGVGAYVADVHATRNAGCASPAHVIAAGKVYPQAFYLPLRAHTNRDIGNMLVAGKTMAQTFVLNAATRLQPIEFASGTGAGVAAALMHGKQMSSSDLLANSADISDIQKRIDTSYGLTEWRNVERYLE